MMIELRRRTLLLGGIRKLDAVHAEAIQESVFAALTDKMEQIELGLSRTVALDGGDVGARLALRNKLDCCRGVVRLLNPLRGVLQA